MRRALPLVVCALLGAISTPRAQEVTVEVLLDRAGAYLDRFVDRFSNVVSEERYQQDWTTDSAPPAALPQRGGLPGGISSTNSIAKRRVLRSDFLLVKPSEEADWTPFRDVFEVDGSPVRDREQRLERLFVKPTGTTADQAKAIADESARYNIGSMERTINNPVLALAFLQTDKQTRSVFKLGRRDRGRGPDVWVLEYRESAIPTLVTGRLGKFLFARGRFWIDAGTGAIVRSEMVLADTAVNARVTTSFRRDDRFGINVPVEMREEYDIGSDTKIAGTATYGRFRRFGVTAEENIETPSPDADPAGLGRGRDPNASPDRDVDPDANPDPEPDRDPDPRGGPAATSAPPGTSR
ncbi:MAG: hypothetical protein AB7Q29_18910 [Vicinamibacterales bacterium]